MFEDVWQRFIDAPVRLGPTPGERERWHRGRSRYAVWLVRVHCHEVRSRVQQAAQALAPWITPVPEEQVHITVLVAGFPIDGATGQEPSPELGQAPDRALGSEPGHAPDPQPGPAAAALRWNDDIDTTLLIQQCEAVRAARPSAPRLAIGGLNCFASAAFLEVHDVHGELECIRECLNSAYAGTGQGEIRFAPYIPHVTVGAFRDTGPVAPVIAAVEPLRRQPLVRVAPAVLELVDFDATHEGVAPFRILAAVELGGVELSV